MYQTEICVKGKINPNWSDWFGELQVQEQTCDETLLLGKLPDMAAVYGVISRLGSLVIPLVSVTCVEEVDADDRQLRRAATYPFAEGFTGSCEMNPESLLDFSKQDPDQA